MAAKPDGKGASAAEANRILRAKFLTLLAFPLGKSGFYEQSE